MTREERKKWIDWDDSPLPITTQTDLLGLCRASLYYEPIVSFADKPALDALDSIYTDHPYYGSRRMRIVLARSHGITIGRDHVRRLMAELGLQAIYPKKTTTIANPAHPVYPYLLRGLQIVRPNQVWGTDFTYIRLAHGFAYLIAFIDWFSRYVLSWALAPTMESAVAVASLNEAITLYGAPEIGNTDQGSQFTSEEYIRLCKEKKMQISMDGRGRCLDNIFTERLWRTVKYEDVFIKNYETINEAKTGLKEYFTFYNNERPHQSLNYRTPAEVYFNRS